METTEHLFLAIAGWTGSPEHLAALARLNDRLRPIRHTEASLIADLDEEIATIGELADRGPPPRCAARSRPLIAAVSDGPTRSWPRAERLFDNRKGALQTVGRCRR